MYVLVAVRVIVVYVCGSHNAAMCTRGSNNGMF